MQTSHGKYVKRQLYGWDWCGDYYDGGLRRINSRRWLLKRDLYLRSALRLWLFPWIWKAHCEGLGWRHKRSEHIGACPHWSGGQGVAWVRHNTQLLPCKICCNIWTYGRQELFSFILFLRRIRPSEASFGYVICHNTTTGLRLISHIIPLHVSNTDSYKHRYTELEYTTSPVIKGA